METPMMNDQDKPHVLSAPWCSASVLTDNDLHSTSSVCVSLFRLWFNNLLHLQWRQLLLILWWNRFNKFILCFISLHRIKIEAEGRQWHRSVHRRKQTLIRSDVNFCAAGNDEDKSDQSQRQHLKTVGEPHWKMGNDRVNGLDRGDTRNKMAEWGALIRKVVTCD